MSERELWNQIETPPIIFDLEVEQRARPTLAVLHQHVISLIVCRIACTVARSLHLSLSHCSGDLRSFPLTTVYTALSERARFASLFPIPAFWHSLTLVIPLPQLLTAQISTS